MTDALYIQPIDILDVTGGPRRTNVFVPDLVVVDPNRVKMQRASTAPRAVAQYTRSGEFVACFKSMSDAFRATDVPVSNILRACKGEVSQAGGSIWKFFTED